MKKLIAVALCAMMIATAFTACKGKDSGNATSVSETSSAAAKLDNKNLQKYVTLCKYENIKIDWTTDFNKQQLDNSLQNFTPDTKEIKNRAVKDGDTVNIDYAGYKGGKAFEGGTANGSELVIGSNSFIDGFESGLIGKMPGKTVNLNLTFPESYGNAELAGKDVVFKVKINFIAQKTYNDKDLLSAKNEVFGTVLMNYMVENSKFSKLPEARISYYTQKFRENYEAQAQQNSYTNLEDYIKAAGETMDSFNKILNTQAEYQAKKDIIASAVAKEENLSVSAEEYKKSVEQYASTYSCTVSEFEQGNDKEIIEMSLLTEKISNRLKQKSECK